MEQNNHIHSFEDIVVPSTCKQQGFTLHKCACGYEHKDNFKPLADHDFETVGGTEPTCTEGGSKTLRCKVCGAEKTEPTPASGHAWGDWNIQEYATCTEDGKQFRFCGMCGVREDQTIPAKGHKLTDPKKSETEEGMVEYFCENCGNTIVQPSAKSKAKSFFAAHKKGLKALVALFVVIAIASTLLLTVFAKPFHYHLAKIEIKLGAYTPAYYNLVACKDYKDAEELLDDFEVVYERAEGIYYDDGIMYSRDIYEFDKYGNPTMIAEYEDGMLVEKIEAEHEYGRGHRLLSVEMKEKEYDDEPYEYEYEFEYDKKGNRVRVIEYDEAGSVESEIEYEYDNDNNIIKMSYMYSYSENHFSVYEYEYDKYGNQIYYAYYSDDIIRSKNEYEYRSKGVLAFSTYYSYSYSDGTYTGKTESEYDEKGEVVNRKDYDADGRMTSETVYEREYDKNGVLMHSTTIRDGVTTGTYEREVTRKGSKATELSYSYDGSVISKTEYEYDKKGNEILCVEYSSDGEVTSRTESTYDRKGNLVEESGFRYTNWDDEGPKKTTYKHEYEYDRHGVLISETSYENGKKDYKFVGEKPIIVYTPNNNSLWDEWW